jgi:hypothetical protein
MPTHLLQFAGVDDDLLVKNVTAFLREGIANGERCIAIATEEHGRALALEVPDLCLLDARDTLDRIMVGQSVDAARFERVVGLRIHELCEANSAGMRGYGELVGLLWKGGNTSAAVRLERLWNDLLTRENIKIFCSYPIDAFGADFDPNVIHTLLCAHSQLVSGFNDMIEEAIMQATRETPDLHPVPHSVAEPAHRKWPILPRGEALILRLRARDPHRASEILARARHHYHERMARS